MTVAQFLLGWILLDALILALLMSPIRGLVLAAGWLMVAVLYAAGWLFLAAPVALAHRLIGARG